MKDQELADRIYKLVGLCGFDALEAGKNYEYVRDARVAMALMEKVYEKQYSFMVIQMPDKKPMMTIQAPIQTAGEHADPSTRRSWASQVVNESLPRAINEACVEVLT